MKSKILSGIVAGWIQTANRSISLLPILSSKLKINLVDQLLIFLMSIAGNRLSFPSNFKAGLSSFCMKNNAFGLSRGELRAGFRIVKYTSNPETITLAMKKKAEFENLFAKVIN